MKCISAVTIGKEIKTILCNHDFALNDYIVTEDGTENVKVFVCMKCGKVKYTT